MPKGQGNNYPFKRAKILVRPVKDTYTTRMQTRLAWNAGDKFIIAGADRAGKYVDKAWAEDVANKIAEVTIQFDNNKQAIVVRIPPPPRELEKHSA